ncbi:MAG: serine/threonine-protein kinase [Candidatus Micrarchaeota archaeon]
MPAPIGKPPNPFSTTFVKGGQGAGKFKGPSEGPADPLVGSMLAERYLILEKIGSGGMGNVYLAEDSRLGKKVAVKVLPRYFASQPEVARRFVQEAKLAPRIEHENIIDVTDLGSTQEGVPFFVMEHLKGQDLSEAIIGTGVLGWNSCTKDILMQICRALSAAHAKGIIHRDMKPENVYIVERSDGSVFIKILDFGIAKLIEQAHDEVILEGESGLPAAGPRATRPGMVMGTPHYMAPEQAAGRAVDHRADIYAVGTLIYEMVTGRVPFDLEGRDAEPMHIVEAKKARPAKRPGERFPLLRIPKELEDVMMKALEMDPCERFQSIEELEGALSGVNLPQEENAQPAAIGARGIVPGSYSVMGHQAITDAERGRGGARRRRILLAAIALAAAGAVAGNAFYPELIDRLMPVERVAPPDARPQDSGNKD